MSENLVQRLLISISVIQSTPYSYQCKIKRPYPHLFCESFSPLSQRISQKGKCYGSLQRYGSGNDTCSLDKDVCSWQSGLVWLKPQMNLISASSLPSVLISFYGFCLFNSLPSTGKPGRGGLIYTRRDWGMEERQCHTRWRLCLSGCRPSLSLHVDFEVLWCCCASHSPWIKWV